MGKGGSKYQDEIPMPKRVRLVSEVSPRRSRAWTQASHFAHLSSIEDDYDVDRKILPIWSRGTVCKAKHRQTQELRLVKTVSKNRSEHRRYLQQEIKIMETLDHPNIIKLHETFEDCRSVSLVMEFCPGGPLLNSLLRAGCFAEARASIVTQQILQAINYMHVSQSICHRDLRLDNVLCVSSTGIGQDTVKLIDFGFAKVFTKDELMTDQVGSLHYMSPQVLAGQYDESCDAWSIGVTLYILLCGHPPFRGETELEVVQKLSKVNFSVEVEKWASLSSDAQDLIESLLKGDPHCRFTPEQALQHQWIRERTSKPLDKAKSPMGKRLTQSF